MDDNGGSGNGHTGNVGQPGATRERDPFRFLMALARSQDVAKYRAGTEQAYLVSNPDYIKRVLADNAANYTKDTAFNATFKRAVADGLLTSEGPEWRRQRRLMQPAFHRERLAALGAGMTSATLDMLVRWRPLADRGEVLNLASEMSGLTFRITARALFGADVQDEADTVGHQIAEGLKDLVAAHTPRFHEAKRMLDVLVDGIVAERRRTGVEKNDLLSMLFEARDEETGEPMDDEELRDQVNTLLLAGYETTANSLGWTWYLLSQNPGPRAKLEAELREVLGGTAPAVSDLQRLPYTKMVLEESLRLFPPAWILGRRALAEDRLGDHVIPAGSVIAISPYAVHRHPGYWEDPDRFEPERFVERRMAGRKPFAYFPFGGGPRLCIGHNFAMLEAQLIIATVAQRYRLELVPGSRVEARRLFVLTPRQGLPMTLQPVPDVD